MSPPPVGDPQSGLKNFAVSSEVFGSMAKLKIFTKFCSVSSCKPEPMLLEARKGLPFFKKMAGFVGSGSRTPGPAV